MSENQLEQVDIVTPYVKNTFFPVCKAEYISLAEIFHFLRHTSYTIDTLSPEARSEYEKALPYLKERFKRG